MTDPAILIARQIDGATDRHSPAHDLSLIVKFRLLSGKPGVTAASSASLELSGVVRLGCW